MSFFIYFTVNLRLLASQLVEQITQMRKDISVYINQDFFPKFEDDNGLITFYKGIVLHIYILEIDVVYQ